VPDEVKEHEKEQGTVSEPPTVLDRSQMPSPPHAAHETATNSTPSHTKVRFLSAALLVIVSAGAGFGGGWLGNRSNDNTTVEQQRVVLNSQGQLINSIAKEASGSVVSVDVTSQSQPTSSFFGYQGATEEQSAGTGIIIDKSGLIITNRHVVPAGATKVGVTLSDGTKYDDVEVVGRTSDSDPLDIAFLRIKDTKGKTLTAAKIGDSSKVGVGDSVVAIGNALGQFQNTVTSGIISGHGRNIQAGSSSGNGSDTEDLQNLFQTDAAINEGNSGGPLMNLSGEVIGINTAVAGGTAQNIGFAIPINDVKGVIDSVMQKGKLERPYIGLVFISITADMAKNYNLGATQGAYVPPSVMVGRQSVIKDAPADKAGIKEGDIITKIGDQKLDENNTLTSVLGKQKVGDTVKVTLIRDGKERTLDVTLSAVPEATTQSQNSSGI
jgi:S1-C subfamily serine protease